MINKIFALIQVAKEKNSKDLLLAANELRNGVLSDAEFEHLCKIA